MLKSWIAVGTVCASMLSGAAAQIATQTQDSKVAPKVERIMPEAAACRDANENLNALLWMQTAVEFRIASDSAYKLARVQLERAVRDPKWSALDQKNARRLPTAIILDVDETVLDNTPMQGELIRTNQPFSGQAWTRWTSLAQAEPIPGAVEFTQSAAKRGVTVFYVTNRDKNEEEATRANLKRLGFPLAPKVDTVLVQGEQPEWTGDKSTRRAHVAEKYRVLMLVGDDLNDFVNAYRLSTEERTALAEKHRAAWGEKWIMLPNPVYGSWERATYGWQRIPDAEMLKTKKSKVKGYEAKPALAR